MRERSRKAWRRLCAGTICDHGVSFYFFTDDNFARKKLWRETFEAIIQLRQEGIKITFMMQVDLARKPKDFVPSWQPKRAAPRSSSEWKVSTRRIQAEGKKQNNVEEYLYDHQRMARRRGGSAYRAHHRPSFGIQKSRCPKISAS